MAYTTINKSTDYFNTKLHDGTGVAKTLAYDFEVDFFWTKMRNDVYGHYLFDAVRGNNSRLQATGTNSANIAGNTVSFGNASGISLGTDSSSYGVNKQYTDDGSTTAQFVGWSWKANGAGSSNTDGSITSTVSANTTAGFSIVSYTGTGANATVGHGLGSLCKWIIIKRLNGTNNWEIGNTAMGWDKHIYFTSTAQMTNSNRFQNTAPTNSLFYIGDGAGVNASGGNYIAYCFAEKKGYSKIGSYTGNGNADGTFVYTGFKPAWIMAKKSNSTGNWVIVDTKRDGYNGANDTLQPNVTDVESGGNRFDIYSNGFKARSTSSYSNSSGDTFIYMVFGQSLVGSNNVPCTAR